MKAKGIVGGLFILALTIVLLVGYVNDILKLVKCDFEAPYKAEVIYGVGAVTGLGAIIGYINIPDGKKVEETPERVE